jgi:hypothetical protein
MDQNDEELRVGDEAFFAPSLALIHFPAETSDPEGKALLHELAHALTFAQSEFYAQYASDLFTSGAKSLKGVAKLMEAVPEVFGSQTVGGRHHKGTGPDPAVVEDLMGCLHLYRNRFDRIWKTAGKPLVRITSPSAKIGQVSPDQLWARTIVLEIVRTALDVALVPDKVDHPENRIRILHEQLAKGDKLIVPHRGLTLREHIELLMGKKSLPLVDAVVDQIRLIQVLENAPDDLLWKHCPLLTAVVGFEFFFQHFTPYLAATALRNITADFDSCLDSFVNRRPRRPDEARELRRQALELCAALTPRHEGKVIILHPEYHRDPRAMALRTILAFRGFMAKLPDLLYWMLRKHPGARHAICRLDKLKQFSGDAATSYLQLLENRLERSDLSQIEGAYRFEAGTDDEIGEVAVLVPT